MHLPPLTQRASLLLLAALLLSCGPDTQEGSSATLDGDQNTRTAGVIVEQTAAQPPAPEATEDATEIDTETDTETDQAASEPEAAGVGTEGASAASEPAAPDQAQPEQADPEEAEDAAPDEEADEAASEAGSTPPNGLLLVDADLSSGEEVYTANCASCHQGEGQGVPGAFPPLAGHAPELALPEGGREYLVHVMLYGLQGEIEVDGESYNGVMPAWQQLSDDEVAGVINYILSSWGNLDAMPEDYAAFSPEEIAAERDAGLSAAEVYEQRQALPEVSAEAGAAADEAETGEQAPAEATSGEAATDETATAEAATDTENAGAEAEQGAPEESTVAVTERQDSPAVAAAKATIPYQYREKTRPNLLAFGTNLNPASNRSLSGEQAE